MAQIVEGEAFNGGRLADALKGLADRIGAHAPHPAIEASWEPVQDRQRGRRERYPPGRPGLRFRDQEHPCLPVQVVPAHGGDLPAPHGGFDRPGDEGAYLPAVDGSGVQEAGLLVVGQATIPGDRLSWLAHELGWVT